MKALDRPVPVEDVMIDLRVELSRDGAADLRVADDPAGAPRPAALSMPIHARRRPVGNLRLAGPRAGECTGEDRRRLAAFADEVGIAFGAFLLREPSLHAAGLRQARTCVGVGLMLLGLLLVAGAAWALGARALPLSWLPMRPGVWTGALFTVSGLILTARR